MVGLTMVMAPTKLPTITTNSASAVNTNKKKRTTAPSTSSALNGRATVTRTFPTGVRSVPATRTPSEPTVRRATKRAIRTVSEDNDDTGPDDNHNDVEEDDGFSFRRKGSVSTSAPVPKKKTTRIRRMSTINSSPLESRASQPRSEEPQHKASTVKRKGKAKAKAPTRKKIKPAPSTEFNFNGIADIPMANGNSYQEDTLNMQRTPIPKHTSKRNNKTSFQHPLVAIDEAEAAAMNGHRHQPDLTPSPTPKSKGHSERIALPLSDTPIIRKNKEMRKQKSGVRRSSLGNRGKRASSIGNGFVAVPHSAVSPQEFYKHLDSSMPEPHRMKQLLLWSLKRVMEKQEETFNQIKVDPKISVEDKTAINVARFIQEEIVRDVAEGRINTSWWNRPEDSNFAEIVKKPNVQNVTNLKNYKAFENRYEELLKEREQWEARLKEVEKLSTDLVSEKTKLGSVDEKQAVYKQYPFLETLNDPSSSSKSILHRLESGLDELEREVEKLEDFVHLTGSLSRATVTFSNKQMDLLSKHIVASRNIASNPDKSVLYTVVKNSKAVNAEDSYLSAPPDGNKNGDNESLRDVLRTITRLERNEP